MCNYEENISDYQVILDDLLIKAQIEGIQKEVQLLKKVYHQTLADYQFEGIRNKHEWDAEETESQEEKLEVYKKMYLEILAYLCEASEEARDELNRKYYPECANLPEEIDLQQSDDADMESEKFPFD